MVKDVKSIAELFPRLEVDGNVVHIQLKARESTWHVDVLFCDEDMYPEGEVFVMCDQDEERAAMCTSELEQQEGKGMRAILNTICKVFGISPPWDDVGTNGYPCVGSSAVQPAPAQLKLLKGISDCSALSTESYEFQQGVTSSDGGVNSFDELPSQPSLFKGVSGDSAFSAESYELPECSVMAESSAEKSMGVVPSAEPLVRAPSCTLRGLTQNLMEPADARCTEAANFGQNNECLGSSHPSSSKSLEEKAISVLLDRARGKLEALSVKDRPKKHSALVSFLQRAVGRDGAKAFILHPIEVVEALCSQGLLTSERSTLTDMLSASSPAQEDVVRLTDCPETQARIIRQATRSKLSKLVPVEVAKWVLMQAYVQVPLSAARLADSLIAAGGVREGSDGKLTFDLDVLPKPPFHIKRLFIELQLSDNMVTTWKEGSSANHASSASQSSSGSLIPKIIESQLSTLAAAFPDHCPSVLSAVLEEHNYDLNSAVEALLDSLASSTLETHAINNATEESFHTGSSCNVDDILEASKDDSGTSLIAKGLDAMAGAMAGAVTGSKGLDAAELAREAEAVAALKQQLSFLDFHISTLEPREENATPDLQRELSMLRRSRAAVDAEKVAAEAALTALRLMLLCDDTEHKATSGQVTVSVNVDVTRSSQSLRGQKQTVISQIQDSLQYSGPWGHYAAYQFAAMLSREQELHKDFVCFYHSYSYAALLYEVQAELARRICKLPDDFAPVPRISMAPFTVCKSMHELRDWAKQNGGNDHDTSFRGVGLSLSCSLFASGSEAPPLSCFKAGYSCTDLSFRKLLIDSLGGNGLAENLADAVVDIGERHGLPVQGYESQSPTSSQRPQRSELTGYMLQIFVHRSIVEKYAYPSQPYGLPMPGGILEYIEKGNAADGQARLYFHPQVMLDPRRARLFHYCARPSQSSLDPAVPSSRGALIKELRKALEPLTGNHLALASTAGRLGLDVAH